MAYIKYKTTKQPFVHVPYWFISDYMPKALSGYTKVYLYLLAIFSDPVASPLSLEEISSHLDMLYSEVLQALKYWNDQGVISFSELSIDEFDLEFYFEQPQAKEAPSTRPLSKTIIRQTRPEYRTEEINLYLQDSPSVLKLFRVAEEYLGRLLTITDQKILFSLYDWLHMPFDLIEYLIEHCASNNHRAIHYIEKVAISWIDEGITTVDAAKEKVTMDKRYFKILNSLGASKSTLTSAERHCMNKWFETYHFNMDIILEACQRTVMQTNKPSLNYTDSILTSWYNDKVKSIDDIQALDKAHESKKMLNIQTTAVKPLSNKISQFNNMYSHDWDFDELEKLQQEHITRKLNGGN